MRQRGENEADAVQRRHLIALDPGARVSESEMRMNFVERGAGLAVPEQFRRAQRRMAGAEP